MNTGETLYIRILIWAYNKQEQGFCWSELLNEFSLNTKQERWVLKVFRSNMPTSENLIDHLDYTDDSDDGHYYVITAKGTSLAVDYLSLEEAKNSGRRAEKLAIFAIAIGVITSIIGIYSK